MKQCVVACQTLRDELEYVLGALGNKPDVIWIESGLHNTPKKLHARLQGNPGQLRGVMSACFCCSAYAVMLS